MNIINNPTFIHITGIYTECNGDTKEADFYINVNKIISFSIIGKPDEQRKIKISCECFSRPLISTDIDYFESVARM